MKPFGRVLVGLALLLAACSTATPPKPAPTSTPAPVTAATSAPSPAARAEPTSTITGVDLPVRAGPTPTLDQLHAAAIRTLINDANRAWAASVGRGGTASQLANFYVEPKLSELTRDVQMLRQQNRVRDAQVIELRLDRLTFASATRAEVVTYERWTDALLEANGTVVRKYPSIVADTYTVVLQNDRWYISGTTEQVIQQ